MTTEKITTAGDVYRFVDSLKAASQQNGEAELCRQLDDAMRLGSSGLEILGAIRQAIVEHMVDVERLLGGDGRLCAEQVVTFVNREFGCQRNPAITH